MSPVCDKDGMLVGTLLVLAIDGMGVGCPLGVRLIMIVGIADGIAVG